MKNKKLLIGSAAISALIVGEAFVGSVDWLNVLDLPKESAIRKASAAIGVGYQRQGNYVSRCNYWSVGQRLVMANGHCIKNGDSSGINVFFTENRDEGILCEKMLAFSPWEEFDYLLLECSADIPAPVVMEPREIIAGEPLLHISHNCNYYADENCEIEPKYDISAECIVFESSIRNDLDFTQGCDSLGGSSGSPVFSRQLNADGVYPVIGLHHSGAFYQDDRGELEGRGYWNGTVKIHHVLTDLKNKGINLTKTISKEPAKPKVSFWRAIVQLILSYFR